MVWSALGLLSYFQTFMKGLTDIAVSIYTGKYTKSRFIQASNMTVEIENLKKPLRIVLLLALRDVYLPFIVHKYASSKAVMRVLCEKHSCMEVDPVQSTIRTMKVIK